MNLNSSFREKNKSVLSLITIYLEYDDHEKVNLNGETLTLTSQLIKI